MIRTIILDTSAYVSFKRDHRGITRLLRSADRILLPTVVLGELLAGFAFGSRTRQNRQDLDQFINTHRVSVVPLAEHTAERYAIIYSYLRKKGRPVPANDMWIAAFAMEHGAVVVTCDSHFKFIDQVLTELFEPI